ncbi:glycosyltransferase family 2 protein [Paenibacillus tarimensis]
MQVFILNAERNRLAERQTMESVHAALPDCLSIPMNDDFAERLNHGIAASAEPFFITLLAGQRIAPQFATELQTLLHDLPENHAGICLPTVSPSSGRKRAASHVPEGPAVWRKDAVVEAGGFPARDWLPFEHYVLLDMRYRLSEEWDWGEFSADCLLQRYYSGKPAWRKEQEEWSRLHPILSSAITAAPVSTDPFFTIVICSYNNAEYLLWSIRSVLIQTFADWELIVIDDGSEDGTQDKLRRLPNDPRVSLIRYDRNRGKAFCLNQALALARGKRMLELDADDWLSPDCLETFWQNRSDMEGTSAMYANHDEWLELSDKQLIYRHAAPSLPAFTPERLLSEAAPLAPRCYNVKMLRSLGGWWESGPFDGRLYEDFQMLVRLSRRLPLKHLPQVLYNRRIRSASVTRSNENKYENWKLWFQQEFSLGRD